MSSATGVRRKVRLVHGHHKFPNAPRLITHTGMRRKEEEGGVALRSFCDEKQEREVFRQWETRNWVRHKSSAVLCVCASKLSAAGSEGSVYTKERKERCLFLLIRQGDLKSLRFKSVSGVGFEPTPVSGDPKSLQWRMSYYLRFGPLGHPDVLKFECHQSLINQT